MKQKNIKFKISGENPNFTPKELEERILEKIWNDGYQIDPTG